MVAVKGLAKIGIVVTMSLLSPNSQGIDMLVPYLMSVYVMQWGVWKFTHDCFLIYNHYYCRDDLVLRNTVKNYRFIAFY